MSELLKSGKKPENRRSLDTLNAPLKICNHYAVSAVNNDGNQQPALDT
ncbi:MAG: hypothetical protein KME45_16770 [Stenomitos rutilans HA7619-LM2]|nr:hypothetical protein [Stenomitos rutilans HA7619-LM2]